MKICICGGGNLGHVIAGFLAAEKENEVSLLTRHPERWEKELFIEIPQGDVLKGTLYHITSHAEEVISDADIVLLCLPGFAIPAELETIQPFLQTRTVVGSVVSSTGFFFEAMKRLPATTPLFGYQRVPFISRIIEYGRSAHLLGYRPQLYVSIEQTEEKEKLLDILEKMFKTPTTLLKNYYEASFTNSNPLLHPSRLFTMWKNWEPGIVYDRQYGFYTEWDNDASNIYIDMDKEFQQLLSKLPVTKGSIPTVLDYYESFDAPSLTRKIRSIEAFQNILAPMKKIGKGFIPDFQDRYFTEDFPYGLGIIYQQAQKEGIQTPIIEKVLSWGLQKIKDANNTSSTANTL